MNCTATSSHECAPLRPVKLGPPDVLVEGRKDGAILISARRIRCPPILKISRSGSGPVLGQGRP